MPVGRPSIYTVADRAGVSIATVSRVLNGTMPVAAATRERVLAAADELRWQPSRLARKLTGERVGAVGLVFPELIGGYVATVVVGFEERAMAEDVGVLVLGTHGRATAERMASDLAEHVDGLVVMDRTITDAAVQRLAGDGTPLVLLARKPLDGIPAVCSENHDAAVELTIHLLEQHGHRRLAFVGDPEAAPDLEQRWQGFELAHRRAGLGAPAPAVRTGFRPDDGYAAVATLLAGPEPPTAVVCATDELASGAVMRVRDLDLALGDDLAVTGWDDSPLARALAVPLTTVDQPVRELGRCAADALFRGIEGDAGESLVLPSRLVLRRSCGC
jgi:LacI family transcriptional regulator